MPSSVLNELGLEHEVMTSELQRAQVSFHSGEQRSSRNMVWNQHHSSWVSGDVQPAAGTHFGAMPVLGLPSKLSLCVTTLTSSSWAFVPKQVVGGCD